MSGSHIYYTLLPVSPPTSKIFRDLREADIEDEPENRNSGRGAWSQSFKKKFLRAGSMKMMSRSPKIRVLLTSRLASSWPGYLSVCFLFKEMAGVSVVFCEVCERKKICFRIIGRYYGQWLSFPIWRGKEQETSISIEGSHGKMSSLVLHCNIIYSLAIHKSNMKSQVHLSMSKSFKHKIDTRWTKRFGTIFSYRLFPSAMLTTWLEPLN